MREQTMIIVFRADLETSKLFLENYVSSETYKHEMFSMNYGSFFLLVFVWTRYKFTTTPNTASQKSTFPNSKPSPNRTKLVKTRLPPRGWIGEVETLQELLLLCNQRRWQQIWRWGEEVRSDGGEGEEDSTVKNSQDKSKPKNPQIKTLRKN